LEHGTTILFGLLGVRVARVEEDGLGGRVVHVETVDASADGCPSCGTVSRSVKEYVTMRPRDVPYGETPIAVLWRKRRWRCVEPLCPRGSFTEAIGEIPPGRRTTGRLRRAIGAAVGDACRSVAEAASAHGVSWPTAHAAFVEHADALLAEPEPTTVLGIDETRRGKPRWVRDSEAEPWRRVDPYDTGFVDLARRSGPARTTRGPQQRHGHGPAGGTGPRVLRGDQVRGDRPGRGLGQSRPRHEGRRDTAAA